MNVMVEAEGDTWIDDHHTCEDIGKASYLIHYKGTTMPQTPKRENGHQTQLLREDKTSYEEKSLHWQHTQCAYTLLSDFGMAVNHNLEQGTHNAALYFHKNPERFFLQLWPLVELFLKRWGTGRESTDLATSLPPWMKPLSMLCL